uniref:Sushi, von Willebrand factor type A, EGF and pentraxin domain-containing protein 1 n=1 Tax=Phallusia mammillata TaxID=59560 RepID=A0A6F9DTG4_9ASCI|nr:sushi, von Willebrand factor type A, EGF and pentraxin domain-containing protein 1 [Phallusia mammillata]
MGNATWFLGTLALLAVVLDVQGMCPKPLPIPFATISPDQTTYEDDASIIITCNDGYRNMGEGVARCEGNIWKVNGGRLNAPRCVVNVIAPVVTLPTPVGFAVSCPANCDLANSQCVIYQGVRMCACNPGFFKHPVEGCVSRSSIIASSECNSCPANSACGRYRNTACFCNNGYFLVSQLRQCVALPAAPVPTTCSRPSGPNLVVAPAGRTVWAVGQSAAFACSGNYALSGQRIATCAASGTFNVPLPTCILLLDPVPTVPVTCSNPSTPANGVSIPVGKTVWNVGEEVRFACNSNYNIQGVTTATCLSTGFFTPHNPSCIGNIAPVQCTGPLTPANGISLPVGTTAWNVGAIVGFQCNSGYRLSGSSTATCTASGTFTAHNPSCTLIQVVVRATCPAPVAPLNGRVNEARQVWREGDRVTYSCNAGFPLSGSSAAVCQSNGEYSNAPPFCGTPQRCSPPVVPFGGMHDKMEITELSPGQNVRYTCRAGFRLYGNPLLRCLNNGSYSSPFPHCISLTPITTEVPTTQTVVSCRNPVAPANSFIIGGNVYFVGQAVQIRCITGYQLVGPSTFFCQANGEFSPVTQRCDAIVTGPTGCGRPQAPINGEILLQPGEANKNFWSPGERVLFNCAPGYNLVGVETLLCQDNGAFNANVPVCIDTIRVVCPAPQLPPLLFITNSKSTEWEEGDIVQFGCPLGFEPSRQPASILCQSNSEYSADPPTCIAITTQPMTTMTAVTCDNPEVPLNGMTIPPDQTSWPVNQLITYECMSGYRMVGLPTRFCQPDGTIFGDVPSCEETTEETPKTCSNPEVPVNARTVPQTQTTWQATELIRYECMDGYELAPGSVGLRFCQPDGTIFGPVPDCRVKSSVPAQPSTTNPLMCTPPQPVNGYIEPQGQTMFDVEVVFFLKCNEGYELQGMERNMCLKDQTLAIELARCVSIGN